MAMMPCVPAATAARRPEYLAILYLAAYETEAGVEAILRDLLNAGAEDLSAGHVEEVLRTQPLCRTPKGARRHGAARRSQAL